MALQDRRSPPSSQEVEILYETPKTPKAVHKSVSEYVEMKRIPTDLVSNRGVRESFAGTVKRRMVTDTSGTADNSVARPPQCSRIVGTPSFSSEAGTEGAATITFAKDKEHGLADK